MIFENLPDTRDPTFSADGIQTTAIGTAQDEANAVVVQGDGKILLGGSSSDGGNYDFALVRYNPDGSLDRTFDWDGKVIVPVGTGEDLLASVALQSDGKIVAAGTSFNGSNTDFAAVRLLGGPDDLLVNGGFETDESLGGGSPTGFGDWRGEQASTVTAENSIAPFGGGRMLKFLGTGIAGGSADNACAVLQHVPMSAYAAEIAAGSGVRVEVTGRFNRVAVADSEFRIQLVGYNGTPSNPGAVTTSRSETLTTDGDPATWEPLSSSTYLPAGTTMVAVYVTAVENINNNPSWGEFDGNYADAVQLTVQTDFTAPTLGPVTITSNNANTAWAKSSDTVTLSFTASEPIETPVVTLLGSAATVANTGGNNWTATATVDAGTAEGVAAFSIAAVDLLGNAASAVTATTDASGVTVDKTAPTLNLPANLIVAATSAAGAEVIFSATATDNLDPSPGATATPASGSTFPLGITTVNASSTDAAGNTASDSFTVAVGHLVDGVVFSTPASVPLTDDGFTATGQAVGPMTLGFDPAPGQVLTLVDNTSANPIEGNFTNLPDGGTIATSYGGRDLLFAADYSGGDGNDLTLTLDLEKSTDLVTFVPFPFVALQTSVNAEGKIEFQFTSPDEAAFFRVEAE